MMQPLLQFLTQANRKNVHYNSDIQLDGSSLSDTIMNYTIILFLIIGDNDDEVPPPLA